MNDQLESLAAAEDHHSSCSEWLLNGGSLGPPARSPSWTSCWARCPNVPGHGSRSPGRSTFWVSEKSESSAQHGSATFEITSRSFEVVRSLVVYLTYPSPCVPLRPPASPCVPLRPLGTWTNVKLPPYLHRTGGHHCFSHSDHHCYCFVFLRSGKAAHLQDIPKHDSHLLRFFEIHAKLPACPVGFTSEYENPVLDIAISSAINGDVTIATSHNPPTWSGRPQQHGTGGLLHTDVGGCWHQQLGECLHRLKTTSDLVLSNSRSPWEKYVMTCHDPIALTDLRYPVTGSTTLERATGLKIMVLRMVLQKRLKTIGRMIFTVVSW